ncbi:MAG: ATP-binding protein [Oscillochloridaceae bacterium]|nr:ATP-binding protein [Chloroflexaceae bacterium]MDW8390474.1 ATP-binding protein [Oscillochloridaceae bacterium]
MDSITLPATLEALARISAFIADAAERAGLDEQVAWQVQLAVDEAATNVIQHAYAPDAPGEMTLSWRREGDCFIVTLRDFGRQFDPGSIPPPDLSAPLGERRAGGLGLYLISRLMDEVRFDFNPQSGNVLTMTRRLTPPEALSH